MPRRKRASAAAARAAKAKAARLSSQQQQQQESREPVPEADQINRTISEAEDHEESETVEQESEVAPPPEEPEDRADELPETIEENVESQAEKSPPADDSAAVTSEDKTPADSSAAATDSEEVEDERSYYVNALLTDKSYLIDLGLGYVPEENLKQPLKCFTTEDELQLFPVIESMSAKLFTIVQKLNACQKKEVEAAAKSLKGIIKIKIPPKPQVLGDLLWVNFLETPVEAEKSPKRAPHPFLLTEDENMFSEEKLKMLRAVLDAGWKREVVMRSPGSTGRKTGDVYYYSPQGTKFRSSKQVEKHLAELADSPFTIENFTFAKVRISTNPEQEIVRKAYDGKSPPRAPPKPAPPKGKVTSPTKGESSKSIIKASSSSSKTSPDINEMKNEEPVKGVSSRRSIQPPKRYSSDAVLLLNKRSKIQDDKRNSGSNKGLMQMGMLPPKYPKGMEDSSSNLSECIEFNELGGGHDDSSGSNSVAMKEIAEDSLFQISALRQSGGIDVDNMHQLVESQKQLAQKAAHAALIQEERRQGTAAGSSKRGITVIPCSIRCPGMEGAVPNLQCVRCLCLFHAECLGLPPNLAFNQYHCSNCTDQQSSSGAAANAVNSQKNIVMKKSGEVKRSPPGLAPIPHGSLRGAVPGRDVTVTLAAKEAVTRLPQKMVPSSVGIARGMIRARGMPPPHGRSPAHMHPGQRMITTSDGTIPMIGGHSQIVKRGRGRPPSIVQSRPMPQLSKNLTITHLPRLPGAPPVPNLQPMATQKALPGKLPLPMMGGTKPRQAIPAVPNLMKSNAFRVTVPPPSLSGRTFKKAVPPSHYQSPTNLRLNSGVTVVNKGATVMYSPIQDRSVSLTKRYPQSVCTIGNKKFVVLPKRRPAEFSPVRVHPAVGNGGPPKGHSIDGMRHPETTIKKIVTIGEQMNCSDNNLAKDEEMDADDGSTEGANAGDTTPTKVGEDGGMEIRNAANETIATKQ